jgi:hypothetical protein
VIATPPLLDGADHDTNAIDDAGLATTPCGADGTAGAVGVTAFDGDEAGPAPAEFDACTTNVYDWPPVSPPTVTLVAGGAPVTVVVACAVAPMYGVTV